MSDDNNNRVLEVQVAVIRTDIEYIKKEIESIKSWGKWAVATVGGTLIISVLQLFMKFGTMATP